MKKHGLFKILSLTIVGLLLLSWFIPASYYSSSEMVDLGLYRIGLYEFLDYPFLAVQYFSLTIILLLTIGGFYGVLGKTGKYRSLIEKIAAKLKGKEAIFLVVISFLLAALQSVFGFGLILFIFIPFICSIILQLGYDKLTALLVSFISILIGTIGSTFDPNVVGKLVGVTGYETSIYARLGLFVICFVVYLLFMLKHAKKAKALNEKKNDSEIEDTFLGERKNNKKKIWPIILVFSLLLVIIILGSTDWSGTFNITWFTKAYNSVMSWTVGNDSTIVAYVLGKFLEFGKWTFTDYAIVLVMASFLLKFIYGIKFDELLESFCEGAVKMLKPAMLITLAYVIVIITAYHPFYATVAAWITNWTSNFNVITTSIVTIIGSALNIEMLYLSQSSIPYIASVFTSDAALNSLSIVAQSMYGLTMIAAPTSAILILGLGYLDIPYTKWIKSSWKLIVELLVVVLAIIIIVTLI